MPKPLRIPCRFCKKEFDTERNRKVYGSCSHVYMLNYCSAKCYKKDIVKPDLKELEIKSWNNESNFMIGNEFDEDSEVEICMHDNYGSKVSFFIGKIKLKQIKDHINKLLDEQVLPNIAKNS